MKNRDEILGRALSGALEQKQKRVDCPSLEEIATLVEGRLSGDVRDTLLGHLAVCAHCREVFNMTAKSSEASGRKRWYYVSAAATAAAAAILALSITTPRPSSEQLQVAASKPATRSIVNNPSETSPAAAPILTARSHKPTRGVLSGEVVQLLTKDEASQHEVKNFGFAGDDLPKEGPEIKVVLPEPDLELKSPFHLAVRFVTKQGSSVDLSTLRVECLKMSTVDLTPRVLPHATAAGISIEKASLPAGNHKIRITVADTKGGVTVEIFTLHVI